MLSILLLLQYSIRHSFSVRCVCTDVHFLDGFIFGVTILLVCAFHGNSLHILSFALCLFLGKKKIHTWIDFHFASMLIIIACIVCIFGDEDFIQWEPSSLFYFTFTSAFSEPFSFCPFSLRLILHKKHSFSFFPHFPHFTRMLIAHCSMLDFKLVKKFSNARMANGTTFIHFIYAFSANRFQNLRTRMAWIDFLQICCKDCCLACFLILCIFRCGIFVALIKFELKRTLILPVNVLDSFPGIQYAIPNFLEIVYRSKSQHVNWRENV